MSEQFAPDQFDDVPQDAGRIGAHRAKRPHVRAWLAILIALGVVLVVIVGAYFIMRGIDQSNRFVDDAVESSAAATQAERGVDKTFGVTVLNGTTDDKAHTTAAKALKAAGWENVTATDSDSDDIETTAVYIVDESYQLAGEQLAADLGIGQVSVLDNYNNPITVVLGADYLSVEGDAEASASPAAATSTTPSASESASPSATEEAEQKVDKSLAVTVYNGTRTSGLAGRGKSELEDAGWKDVEATNADSRTDTSSVHYAKKSQKATAVAVAEELGIEEVTKQDGYDTDIAVILGTDFR